MSNSGTFSNWLPAAPGSGDSVGVHNGEGVPSVVSMPAACRVEDDVAGERGVPGAALPRGVTVPGAMAAEAAGAICCIGGDGFVAADAPGE